MFPENPSENSDMSISAEDIADETRRLIAAVEPRQWNDTRESWLARVAYKLGMPAGRIRRLFYREVARVPAHEYLTLKARAAALEERQARRREYIDETAKMVQASDSKAAEVVFSWALFCDALAHRLEEEVNK